jgi:aldehyde:ferredoxin oxidoreductase
MSRRFGIVAAPSADNNEDMHGYHGGYWRIDVTTGQAARRPLAEAVLRRFLGGAGLGAWLLLHEGRAADDAYAPASPLVFVFSPLVGSPLTTSAKFAVVSKSPLTERFNDSLASSGFALNGKKTAADAIMIVGRAPRLSVLIIDGDDVRLEPADELAGLSGRATETALRQRLGNGFDFAVIGPAGERGVRFATLSHDGRHAGRGGHGAVLGSKNIKAVAVRGSRRCSWAEPSRLSEFAKELSKRSLGPATAKYRELGTVANLVTFNRLQALPVRNFQQSSFEHAERLSPESLAVQKKVRSSCAACTIGCEHFYGLAGEEDGVRLEYENLFALGPLCGVSDASSVLRASQRCDELGIDTISAGGTIAFAMECVERGLLDEPWLRFGDAAALQHALDLIGTRSGLGARLADGSRRMAEAMGPEALRFAPQVKGLEIPGYEPRSLQTMALGFAVGARGADHNRSGAYEADFSDRVDRRHLTPAAAAAAIETEDQAAIMDSLILCKFLRGVFQDYYSEAAEMLQLITGWNVSADELRHTAQRIVAAKKLFNIQAGWTPVEDTLPSRFLESAPSDDPSGILTGRQLAEAIVAYNQLRRWTAEGYLPEAYLEDMEIGFTNPQPAA